MREKGIYPNISEEDLDIKREREKEEVFSRVSSLKITQLKSNIRNKKSKRKFIYKEI